MSSPQERLSAILNIGGSALAIETCEVVSGHRTYWWTWADLDATSRSIIDTLQQVGAKPGVRIGLVLRGTAAHVSSLLASVIGGWCAVAFNPSLPPERLCEDVRKQRPSILIGSRSDFAHQSVGQVVNELRIPVLYLPDTAGGSVEWHGQPVFSGDDKILLPDVLIEMLTSGTTGTPKRVPLMRTSFEESLESAEAYEKGRSAGAPPQLRSGVRIVTAPLTHISGLWGVLTTLAEGRKLALLERFKVEDWVAAVKRHHARVANLPPTALRMVLDANVPAADLASLTALRSGTAPLEAAVTDAFLQRYNLPILQQYGATEFAGGVAGWTLGGFREHYLSKRGSAGQIQKNIEARIIDEVTGETVSPGGMGILELRGRQLGDPLRWVRTSDRASLDEDNYVWIHGRADNAINRGGFKIDPDEIVRAIQEHPSVREAVVSGVSDTRLGEVPAAVVMLKEGRPGLSGEDLTAFLREKLLPYQLPAYFHFADDVPRTPSLKPSGPDVRKLLERARVTEPGIAILD